MTNPNTVIHGENVSVAWAHAYVRFAEKSDLELAPLILSFDGVTAGEVTEDPALRVALDGCLVGNEKQEIDTVANTIFPQSLSRMAGGDRQKLYEIYRESLPSYVEMAPSKNSRGLYFARLIGFDLDPKTGETNGDPEASLPDGNQLEFIIENCKKTVRRSMFQASIFDPRRDHHLGRQIPFPCLQHLQFVPDFSEKTLGLNAFYATQQMFEKAYGNYLGLARLASFVAREVGLSTVRVTSFIGVAKMERRPKADTAQKALLASAKALLARTAVQAETCGAAGV